MSARGASNLSIMSSTSWIVSAAANVGFSSSAESSCFVATVYDLAFFPSSPPRVSSSFVHFL